MTDSSPDTTREKLGIGRLIGEAFSIFANNFIALAILALIPALAIELIDLWYFRGPLATAGTPAVGLSLLAGQISMSIVGSAVATALIVRLAYDAKSGQRIRMQSYVRSTAAVILPLIVCSFAASLAFIAGLGLLIVPGLYIGALWWCITPAIVIEHAGYRCFHRSAELTSGYRWACVGLYALMSACVLAIDIAAVFMTDLLMLSTGPAASVLFAVLATGMSMSFSAIVTALVYARLREIKEGTGLAELAEVFA